MVSPSAVSQGWGGGRGGFLGSRAHDHLPSPPAQPYIAIDWEPEMKKRYYDEVEAEVSEILGMGGTFTLCHTHPPPPPPSRAVAAELPGPRIPSFKVRALNHSTCVFHPHSFLSPPQPPSSYLAVHSSDLGLREA